jgi:hypothetical protein
MDAMRSHESDIASSLALNVEGYLSEELRKKLVPTVVASFKKAQVAWDAYRQHLDEHGLLELITQSGTAD